MEVLMDIHYTKGRMFQHECLGKSISIQTMKLEDFSLKLEHFPWKKRVKKATPQIWEAIKSIVENPKTVEYNMNP